MKKLLIPITMVILFYSKAEAQNTFPNNGNVGIGTTSPAVRLHVVGTARIADSKNNTFIGGGNTTVGANTLNNGKSNVAIGHLAAPTLTTGNSNVCIGIEAGSRLTTGSNNFSLGSGSLFKTTSGGENVAIGTVAMFENVDGGQNVGVGHDALHKANGYHNTAIGFRSGFSLTSGTHNTFIGYEAGNGIITGYNNTIIGGRITPPASTLTNTVIIADGDGQIRFFADAAGNVGIGTTAPGAYKLAVKGDAIFTKVKVTPTAATWPDYVFQPTYKLPTLQEVEAFIKANKHLPGVPSAAEIEKEGLDVGGNQAVMLKKIEELTLYLIDLKKEVDSHKQLIEQQAAIIQAQQPFKQKTSERGN